MRDKQHVTHPADYLTAVASIYWLFDVAFHKQPHKTITFLARHLCFLMPFKTITSVQKVLSHSYDLRLFTFHIAVVTFASDS